MRDAPVIRPARADEIERVGELWRAMYDYQRAHGMLLPLRDDAAEIWTRQLASRLDSPVSVILVSESNDGAKLTGFLAAQVKRLPPHLTTDNAKVGFISEVFVEPAVRRHKVGEALVAAAFAWFDRALVGSVELHVVVGNDVARDFWERMGFVPELVQMRANRGQRI
jgi:GNAT superfamily N-acetyltransferase